MSTPSSPLDSSNVPALTPPSATQSMLAPDGTPGEIPVEHVQDALGKGFKMGVNMTAPDGTRGTIPVDKAHEAVASGFRPLGSAPTGAAMNKVEPLTGGQVTQGEEQSIENRAARVQNSSITPVTDAASVIYPAMGLGKSEAAAASSGARKIIGASAERASQNFETVREFAGNLPVNSESAGKIASDTYDMAKRGGSMPKVMRDFLARATDPEKGAITYNEARDFYSNASRLSANETQRLTPVMQRQVAMFTQELGNSIKQTADHAGTLEELNSAMKEYRNVKRIEEATDYVKKAVAKGIPYVSAYFAAKKLGLFDMMRGQ